MRRTIPVLYGLAILGVIFNHANWHVLKQFTSGEPQGYPFLVLDQIAKFAIVGFMFIAGYFIAYATNGGKRDLSWQIVLTRLKNLVWPWLIWAMIMTAGHAFQGRSLAPVEFLRNLFIQYYFVPLLIFYYLLATIIARWAKVQPRRLLIGAAVIQLLAMALFYARVYLPAFPGLLHPWIDLGPLQYLRFAFYFPFGVVCGMFPQVVKTPLNRFKIWLPWLTLFFFGLSAVESAIAYHLGGRVWPTGGDQTKLTSALFSITLILCFLVFDQISAIPFNHTITKLGVHSYGLYLSHYLVLSITARLIQMIMPGVASQGWLLLPLLFILTVVLARGLMEGVARLPTKRFYRYLFG
jgi:peptidoglycan/LPS O-acetylase OafA/YrhL